MSDKIPIAVNVDTGKTVYLDIDFLIDQKMQILGNSRSGKSRGGRTIAERANGKIHQIIISPKREFVTLREKFDYIHVGRTSEISKPDIELNTRYAEQLALDIMKVGMDVIIEFSETPKDRIKFGKLFAEGLMQVPQQYWHPTMIIWDEIDIWAPEKGHGEAESLGAIVDLAARGGDKGYCLVAITQKLAKFNKDVASELNIKFVGNVSLDTDQTRAADELGLPRTQKRILAKLGRPNYHFYAYGPGISDEVIKIKFDDPVTTHIPGWKLNKNQKPIPTPAKVKEIISQFSDLPAEAEKELKTKDDLNNKIKELTVRLNHLQKEKTAALSTIPKVDPAAVQKAHDAGFQKGIREAERQLAQIKRDATHHIRELYSIIDLTKNNIDAAHTRLHTLPKSTVPEFELQLPKEAKLHIDLKLPAGKESQIRETVSKLPSGPTVINPLQSADSLQIDYSNGELSGPERKILSALLVQKDRTASRAKIALLTKYSVKGGGYLNVLGKLRSKGYLQYQGDILTATDLAADKVTDLEQIPTTHDELLSMWKGKLGDSKGKILEAICAAYPNPISKEELAEKTGYTASGGGFLNNLGAMRTLNLIDYLPDKQVIATKEMFPE